MMVAAATMWYDDPVTSTDSQQWWHDIQPALTGFYDIMGSFSTQTPRSQILMWMIECHDSITFLEQISIPADALNTRGYVLAAISDMSKSLAYFIADEPQRSRAYWRSAMIEFEFVQESVFMPEFLS